MSLLENNRIRLRALEPEDLALLYQWENDSDLWSWGNSLIPYSHYTLKEYILQAHRDIYDLKQLRLVVEQKSNNKAIGLIDLFDFDPHHRRAGMGILIDKTSQKNGFASEAVDILCNYAFVFLKLHQIYVHIPVCNEVSTRLFSRCGFTQTGLLSDWIIAENDYMDVLVMQKINHSTTDQ
ncbi:GNAT family protein [Parabacteroides sp. PF5-9]|uniref:GNAT family N-acetyltransferase n=1 Tax=Parabacteroides sp. PF5-9 TaxID=1742404 RepID=UPI002477282D|nr:GNAT family protein [Parabacteroides sp. PF5-9]MDH6357538.1 diamine N-acetyltransferase [Parabacteroides sp. PF5-9]